MSIDTRPPPSPRRTLLGWTAAGALAVVVVIVAAMTFGGAGAAPTSGAAGDPASAPVAVDPATGELLLSTTYTQIDAAPLDTARDSATDGLVVHPIRETPVHDAPGGRAIARMPQSQFGDTWLPVIGQQPGWVQVLLPSKPNSSTGWLRAADVADARTPYRIEVHLASKRLDLLEDGVVVDSWEAGIGTPAAPTPAGRTFLLGAFTDDEQSYSPVILPLGAHSPTHDTFGGGPGTVAIHTWPSAEVFGTASSDGCIRIPRDALHKLAEVPLGTLVMITED